MVQKFHNLAAHPSVWQQDPSVKNTGIAFEIYQLDCWESAEEQFVEQQRVYLGTVTVPRSFNSTISETDILEALKKAEVCSLFGEKYPALTTRNRKVVFIENCQADDSDFDYVIGTVRDHAVAYGLIRIEEEVK